MDNDLLQSVIEIVFMGNMKYLAPFLLLMMATLFVDRLVEFITSAIQTKRTRY